MRFTESQRKKKILLGNHLDEPHKNQTGNAQRGAK